MGHYRTEILARARNILLEKACSKEFEEFNRILMADLDHFSDWDTEKMIDSIRNPEEKWDAIRPATIYDMYAIRGPTLLLNPEVIELYTWVKFLPGIGSYYAKYLMQDRWIKVESAFGGLCFLNEKTLEGVKYAGLMSPSYLEDLLYHDFSNDCIYRLDPEKFDKQIQLNKSNLIDWRNSGFLDSKIPENVYICEHAQFFFNRRKKGRDRIYINSRWKHYSNEHPNYIIKRNKHFHSERNIR